MSPVSTNVLAPNQLAILAPGVRSSSGPYPTVAVCAYNSFHKSVFEHEISRTLWLRLLFNVTSPEAMLQRLQQHKPQALVIEGHFDCGPATSPTYDTPQRCMPDFAALMVQIRERSPGTHVLALLMTPNLRRLNTVLKLGADGAVIHYEHCLPHVLHGLYLLAHGQSYLCPQAQHLFCDSRIYPHLTDAELGVVGQLPRLITDSDEGRKLIAQELGISVKTINTYIGRLREKLTVYTIAEIVQVCQRMGVLP